MWPKEAGRPGTQAKAHRTWWFSRLSWEVPLRPYIRHVVLRVEVELLAPVVLRSDGAQDTSRACLWDLCGKGLHSVPHFLGLPTCHLALELWAAVCPASGVGPVHAETLVWGPACGLRLHCQLGPPPWPILMVWGHSDELQPLPSTPGPLVGLLCTQLCPFEHTIFWTYS